MLSVSPTEPDCFRTISDAVAAAGDGDVIAVRPGTYTEAVVLDRDVTLSGAGAAGEVRIESAENPALRLSAERATISGIVLAHTGGEAALDLTGGTLYAEECVVSANSRVAVVVRRGADLRARECRVGNGGGAGVLVFDGGQAELRDCALESISTIAVVVRARGTARLVGCTIADAQGAVLAADGAGGDLEDCRLQRIGGNAIVLEADSTLALTGTSVFDVDGVAVLVGAGSQPVLRDCRIERTAAQAVVVVQGASVVLERVVVESASGHAVHVVEGSSAELTDCTFRDTGHDAVLVGGAGRATLTRCAVESGAGMGVIAEDNAEVTLLDGHVTGVERSGLVARRGARLAVAGGSVRECETGAVWEDGATGELRDAEVVDNRGDGVVVTTTQPVEVRGCRVERNRGRDLVGVADRGAGPEPVDARGRADATGPAGQDRSDRQGPHDHDRRGRQDERGRAVPAAPGDDLDALLAELDSLVGLAGVKREVETLVRLHQMAERRAAAGLPSPPLGRHLVFAGAPGTGKTTVARLYGRILAALGVLRVGQLVEVARADLVASVIGGTALKTAQRFEAALGGVLFIDEAYTLAAQSGGSGPDFGREAIDTLVKLMEDHRDDVVVIVAGYTNDMRSFLAANPGLSSRFSRTIEFTDYSSAEMVTIVEGMCTGHDYRLEFETRAALHTYFTNLPRDASFGNGRTARKVFEEMIGRQAYRLAEDDSVGPVALTRLLPDDLGPLPGSAVGAGAGRVDEERVEELLGKLRGLVGLDDVKREVAGMVDLLASARQRQAAGLPVPSLSRHLIFAGPPGTGKTTVARLYGSLLTALGALAQGQVTEVSRADLVGEYVGHTARRTTEAFDRARGGVLFIDEAYTLSVPQGGGHDFGREAIDTLVKLMEDHRDEVVVIAAGYEREMEGFLAANPGLSSRFSHRVRFANYTPDELVTIMTQHAHASGYECSGATVAALRAHFAAAPRGESFGNGRYARQVLDEAVTRHARRMRGLVAPTINDLCLLLPEDIPSPAGSAPGRG
ncbi:sporulation protein [Saccharothrix yanglingensis]|uniref:Sporulation protein n=1 Tax=Saccharothrix yanglingensis TaxID=659496 RepID=A0ABU0XAF2_9PSEU|nr:sporulation protein [Saccharothrix yanglingensis]